MILNLNVVKSDHRKVNWLKFDCHAGFSKHYALCEAMQPSSNVITLNTQK